MKRMNDINDVKYFTLVQWLYLFIRPEAILCGLHNWLLYFSSAQVGFSNFAPTCNIQKGFP